MTKTAHDNIITGHGVLNVLHATYQVVAACLALPKIVRALRKQLPWGDRVLLRVPAKEAEYLPPRLRERRRIISNRLYRAIYPHLSHIGGLMQHIGYVAVEGFPRSPTAARFARELRNTPSLITPEQLEALSHLSEEEMLACVREIYAQAKREVDAARDLKPEPVYHPDAH